MRPQPVRSASARRRGRRLDWSVERLEGRQMLATLVVTSTADTVNPNDGVETLREAILDVRKTPTIDSGLGNGGSPVNNFIVFQIPGSGVHTITPTSVLPEVWPGTIIDGQAFANRPTIELNGTLATSNTSGNSQRLGFLDGLLLDKNCTVRGLVINNFRDAGIVLGASDRVEADFLGTDPTGTIARGNGVGVLGGSFSDTIGGTAAGVGNLIAGNRYDGVKIATATFSVWRPDNPYAVAEAGSDMIQGNLIGTDVSGTRALGNGGSGVYLTDNGFDVMAGNVISGNAGPGITATPNSAYSLINGQLVQHSQAQGNSIQGNEIGTDRSGVVKLGNGGAGVALLGAPSNTVGGPTVAAANVISANLAGGITISGAASGIVVQGNVINSNVGAGVRIDGAGATGNLVLGNFIGTDATGTRALPNTNDGVYLTAPGNTVGGTAAGAANVLSGNLGRGVRINSNDNVVQGNRIGTDLSGTRPCPTSSAVSTSPVPAT